MRNSSRLDTALARYVIVLDTSFAMQEAFDAFLQNNKPTLQRNRILVPYKVVQEVNRIIDLHDDRGHVAEFTLHLLERATKDGIAEYRRDPQDDKVVNDAVISRVVEGVLPRRDVLVLTHDGNLTNYLNTKTQQQSFRVKDLIVAGVNVNGELFAWRDQHQRGNGRREGDGSARRKRSQQGGSAAGRPSPFAMTNALASSLGRPLQTRQTAHEGDALFLKDGSRITLRRTFASGGEGTIYELDDRSLLCKVYHQNKLTADRQEKIELMLTRTVNDPMICWPREAVYDSASVFRGFIMRRAPGKPVPLGHSLFIPAAFVKTRLSWTRLESSRLAMTILQKIERLHDMNVLIGDINPQNILLEDEKTVYFVDCDSYQVEGYPCPVGTVNFTAPEIQGSDFRHFLRTNEHELFSVATLLFMIFMPGKSPYSHQGGEDGAANIRKMHFPYALGGRGSEEAPEGPWRRCWSHLIPEMKEAFDCCFHESHRGESRVSIEKWLLLLDECSALLSNPRKAFMGPRRQIGFDLSILPQNTCRAGKQGAEKPRWPNDSLTDRDRDLQRLVAEANPVMRPAGTASTQTIATASPQSSGWPTQAPAKAAPTYPPPITVSGYGSSTKGGAADQKWIIGILVTVLVAAIAALVGCYWGPIIKFVEEMVCLAAGIGVIIGIVALLSRK